MFDLKTHKVYFSTYTVSNWIKTFEDFPHAIQKILNTFSYLSQHNICEIYAFVIMPDHVHLIWKLNDITVDEISNIFKSFTAKEILNEIQKYDSSYLENFVSERKDRKFKFWKLSCGELRIHHPDILKQKIKYIHENPLKGIYKTVDDEIEYYYSSANSYEKGNSEFSFLKLISY